MIFIKMNSNNNHIHNNKHLGMFVIMFVTLGLNNQLTFKQI
jgi:hypothetical protein